MNITGAPVLAAEQTSRLASCNRGQFLPSNPNDFPKIYEYGNILLVASHPPLSNPLREGYSSPSTIPRPSRLHIIPGIRIQGRVFRGLSSLRPAGFLAPLPLGPRHGKCVRYQANQYLKQECNGMEWNCIKVPNHQKRTETGVRSA